MTTKVLANENHLNEFQNKNYDAAFRYSYLNAVSGDSEAQYIIGVILVEGLGSASQDIKQGLIYLENSSKQGFNTATLYLADAYDTGEIIKSDPKTSLSYFLLAESSGAPDIDKKILKKTIEVYGDVSEETCKRYVETNIPHQPLIAQCIEKDFIEGKASLYWLKSFDSAKIEHLFNAVPYLLNFSKDQYAPELLIERIPVFYGSSTVEDKSKMDLSLLESSKNIDQNWSDFFQLAISLYNINRPANAWMPLFESSAENHIESALKLAEVYENGEKIEPNQQKVLDYLTIADSLGAKNLKNKILSYEVKLNSKTSKKACSLYDKKDRKLAITLAKCADRGFIATKSTKFWLWAFNDGNSSALKNAVKGVFENDEKKFIKLLKTFFKDSSDKEQKILIKEIKKQIDLLNKTKNTKFQIGKIIVQERGTLSDGKLLIESALEDGHADAAVFLARAYSSGDYSNKNLKRARDLFQIAQDLGVSNLTAEILKLERETGNETSVSACKLYNKNDLDNSASIARCIDLGHIMGNQAVFWLKDFEHQGTISSYLKAIEFLLDENQDEKFVSDIAKNLPNFALKANNDEKNQLSNIVYRIGLSEDTCIEKKDDLGFITQGNVSLCAILAESGNIEAIKYAIDFWSNGTSDFSSDVLYADVLQKRLEDKFDQNGLGDLCTLMKGYEEDPRKHLSKAKQFIEEDDFMNQACIGEALSFQMKILIGDQKKWRTAFKGKDEIIWVLENVDWNSLDENLLINSIVLIEDGALKGKVSTTEMLENYRTIEFNPDWFRSLNDISSTASANILKYYININCDAYEFIRNNVKSFSVHRKLLKDSKVKEQCRSLSESKDMFNEKNATESSNKQKSDSTDNQKISKKQNRSGVSGINIDEIWVAFEDSNDNCETFGKYISVRENFRNEVDKSDWPSMVKEEISSIKRCVNVSPDVASYVSFEEFEKKNYKKAFELAEFACAGNNYKACGLAGYLTFWKGGNIESLSSLDNRSRKRSAKKLADKGFLNGDNFSGLIKYDLEISGVNGFCSTKGDCPGDDLLETLLNKDILGASIRKASQCIDPREDFVKKGFGDMIGKSCSNECKIVKKMSNTGLLDPISLSKANKLLTKRRCR